MAKATLLNMIPLLFLVAGSKGIDDDCIRCLCEFINSNPLCDFMVGCHDGVCGPYGITMPYWIDGGSPSVSVEGADASTRYQQCATDMTCAESVIRTYMTRYSQDCNQDGKVDCFDFAAIHASGPMGCRNPLRVGSNNVLQNCLYRSNTIPDDEASSPENDAEMVDIRGKLK